MDFSRIAARLRFALVVAMVAPLIGCSGQAGQYRHDFDRLTRGDQQARALDVATLDALTGKAAFWAGLILDPGVMPSVKGADAHRAAAMYRKALDGGVRVAGYNLVLLSIRYGVPLPSPSGNVSDAVPALLKGAANEGCVAAMLLQAKFYEVGAPGFKENPVLAADAYQAAANFAKDPRAEYELGKIYLDGRGRPVDIRLGIQLLTSAASSGIAEAAAELANRAQSPGLKSRWFGVAAMLAPDRYEARYRGARKGMQVAELIDLEDAMAVWRDAYALRLFKPIAEAGVPWQSL